MKKNNYLISVIIPFYNAKKYLAKSIKSVLDQTYKNIEILIIDDCSTDGSHLIAKKFSKIDKRIKLLRTQKNSKTVAVPRNIGIKNSKGKYISFLDSDDLWKSTKLEEQINCIKKKLICVTACDYTNNNGSKNSGFLINYLRILVQIFFFNQIKKGKYYLFYIYNPVIVSSALIDKKIFKKRKNLFNEDKKIREDLFLWLSIFRYFKKNFIFLKKITLTIRRSENSMSSNTLEEFGKIINTLVNDLLKKKNFNKIFFIVFGILIRTLKFFISRVILKAKKNLYNTLFVFLIFYTTIYYTPFFWHLGKPLLFTNVADEKIKNYLIYSGDKNFSSYSLTFISRYNDLKNLKISDKNVENIILIGQYSDLPQQKLIETLLTGDGIAKEKIFIYYENFDNTIDDIKKLNIILNQKKIKKLILSTSPYVTFKSKLLWDKYTDIDIYINRTSDWPNKNKLFSYAKNKKIILYEYFSIFFNKILNRL